MDIRKFFSPINKKTSVAPNENGEKKRKIIIESDDEEDPLPSRCRKNKVLESDSDDDLFVITPQKKVNKISKITPDSKSAYQSLSKSKTPKQAKEKSSPKLKPVSVNDYFNSSSSKLKLPTKRKVEDEAFEKTLEQLDATKESSKKSKKDMEAPSQSKEESPEATKLTNGTHGLSSKLAMKMRVNFGKHSEKSSREDAKQLSPPKREKDILDNDEKPKSSKQQVKTKLTPAKETKSISVNETKCIADKESKSTPAKESKSTPAKETKSTPAKESKSTPAKESKSTPAKESKSTPAKESKSTPAKESKSTPAKESKSTPAKETKSTPRKKTKSTLGKRSTSLKNSASSLNIQVSPKVTPAYQQQVEAAKQDENPNSDLDEQKKQRAAAYRKFLNRSGPKNPGGKTLPEGAPNCLSKFTFVITGVLETIDREETAQLIQKYGGRVTTMVSRNTSFLVVGDEPGQSKTKKAQQLGTPLLDEDELFQLIKTQSPKESAPIIKTEVKDRTNKGDAKAKSSSFHAEVSKTKTSLPSGSMASSSILSSSPSLPAAMASKASKMSPDLTKEISPKSSHLLIQGSPNSEAGSSQATEPLSSQELTSRGVTESSLWVDKYRPASLKNIIGQQGEQSNAKKLLRWLRDWSSNHSGGKKKGPAPGPWGKDNTGSYFKAALLSGPPGVGKTTTAHVVCRDLEFDVVELNASDTRSKRTLAEEVTELLSNTSLAGFATGNSGKNKDQMRKRVLIMDEVDGMAGNEDRGGVQELIALIKGSRTPIICLCNDRNHQKIRSLSNYCFDLRFQKPRIEQIRSAMMTVCFREGIKIRPESLDQMITGSNQDIRQVLHHLSLWSAIDKSLDSEEVKKDAKSAKKDYKLGPWDVCSQVFSASSRRQMSIHDKVSLFFHDYSFGPLFVQENYLKVSPDCARGDRDRLLKQIAMTAQVLADSDIVEKSIRRDSAWSLLPTQAIFSTVCPGEYMAGHLSAQIEFPSWLGKNSSRNKFDRIAQEIQTHARLRISGNKEDIILDYSPMLRNKIVTPLSQRGADGVREAVDLMLAYNFLREDWDSLVELCSWPGQKDPRAGIDAKVKAAFTRTLNKESLPTPFGIAPAPRKSSANPHAGSFGDLDEERISSDEDEDENDDISKSAMIKRGKLSQKTESGKKDSSSAAKGKGKGARGVKK